MTTSLRRRAPLLALACFMPLAASASTACDRLLHHFGSALADATSFKVPLTGAQGVPPVDTAGTGTAELTYDPATRVVTWNITYSGLSSASTMKFAYLKVASSTRLAVIAPTKTRRRLADPRADAAM